jgi:hypothetical protein
MGKRGVGVNGILRNQSQSQEGFNLQCRNHWKNVQNNEIEAEKLIKPKMSLYSPLSNSCPVENTRF